MHRFTELIDHCTKFSIETLKEVDGRTREALEIGGETIHVRSLQMTQMHRAILAVGMFSLFEASLQDALGGDGFGAAKKILDDQNEPDVKGRLDDLILAINVLKHGRGRSYNALVAKAESLSFKVKLDGEDFFDEGNVAEIRTLVEVDDEFVQRCADAIADVSEVVRRVGFVFT